jgi:hypothetical protein
LFEKFYPATSSISSTNFFCNNANSALLRSAWRNNQFDEALTGLEDMELGKRLVSVGHSIGYVADAPVIHVHEESWRRVRIRYEREAIALQHIMPEVHVSMLDATRWFVSGVIHDWGVALRERKLLRHWREIILFRAMQYLGTYEGNVHHRKISRVRREEYFYPKPLAAKDAPSLSESVSHSSAGLEVRTALKAAA